VVDGKALFSVYEMMIAQRERELCFLFYSPKKMSGRHERERGRGRVCVCENVMWCIDRQTLQATTTAHLLKELQKTMAYIFGR
jgi:hypothetical protein